MKNTPILVRSFSLAVDDFEVERGGDGRTVTAYASTFGDPYEVMDFEGHYDEIINRSAFDRFLSGGIGRVKVMYNHGRTPSGSPSDKWSSPIAVPVEVKPDGKGLLTRSKYATTDGGEQALTEWREGLITAQSFRGPIWRSSPPRSGPNGRPVRERLDLGLIEYGPAVFATNESATLVAIRSALLDDRLAALDDLSDEERADLARRLTLPAPSDAPDGHVEPEASGDVDAPDTGPSERDLLAAAAAQRRRRPIS